MRKIGTPAVVFAVVGVLLPWFFYEFFQVHRFDHADPWLVVMPWFYLSCFPLVQFHGLNFKLTEPLPLAWVFASSAFNLTVISACAYLLGWSRQRKMRQRSVSGVENKS